MKNLPIIQEVFDLSLFLFQNTIQFGRTVDQGLKVPTDKFKMGSCMG